MTTGPHQIRNFAIHLLDSIADILFPPLCPVCRFDVEKRGICEDCLSRFRKIEGPSCTRCGKPFAEPDGDDHPCGSCIIKEPPFHRAESLYHYEGVLAEAVRRMKYSKKSHIAIFLGDLMASHPMVSSGYDIVVPVPLHIRRLRERGFNQSQLLAERIGKKHLIDVDPLIMKRSRPTAPQAGMNSKERMLNVKGAFTLRDGAEVRGGRILLVDDVYTTGATVCECCRVLKKGGAERVDVLTLARVVD